MSESVPLEFDILCPGCNVVFEIPEPDMGNGTGPSDGKHAPVMDSGELGFLKSAQI